MTKYYRSIGRDPFEVLPLTFHIKSGTKDKVFYQFRDEFLKLEQKTELYIQQKLEKHK
jgi:hypothetical protein